jgi:hypothetical protein
MSSYGVREGTGAGERIIGAIRRNPEGLLLLAAGCALLMRRGSGQRSRRSYAEDQYFRSREDSTSGIRERVGEAARRAGEHVSEATDKISETARSYASSAAEYADEAQRAAAERSRQVADKARETADYVVREQPWAVALTGLVAGAAVAAAFPPTRIEKSTLGELGEHLRSAAGQLGERVKDAGIQAGERLTEIAEERGLTKEGLKQAARDVGGTFSSTLAGEQATSKQNQSRSPEPRGEARRSAAPIGSQASKSGAAPGSSTTQNRGGGRT